MTILGISCYYHDAAAALIADGKILAAAEEERFSRKKHDSSFPYLAIDFCLKFGKITPEELDYVAFYEKPFVKFHRILISSLSTYPKSYASFREAMRVWLTQKLWIKQEIASYLKIDAKKILFSEHHFSHAASCFYPSPFAKAAILTVDGVGEWTTASFGVGEENKIALLREIHYPQSLGLLYSAFTAFLGFKVNNGEWKVMGMSPYGKPLYVDKIYKIVKPHQDGSFSLDFSYFSFHYSDKTTFSSKFIDLFGNPIPPKKSYLVTERAANIAASIQKVTEELLLSMVKNLRKRTRLENLCLAGGVALNSVANYKILKESGFKNIYIQPAAGDSGGALGAALYAYHHVLNKSTLQKDTLILSTGETKEISEAECNFRRSHTECLYQADKSELSKGIPDQIQDNNADLKSPILASKKITSASLSQRRILTHAYLGQQWSNKAIKQFLDKQNIPRQKLSEEELIDFVSEKIKKEKVIGFMQGRFEWGPRALGNRSILADPRNPKMKDIINAKVKFREAFRPFAPSVLAEHAHKVFELPQKNLGGLRHSQTWLGRLTSRMQSSKVEELENDNFILNTGDTRDKNLSRSNIKFSKRTHGSLWQDDGKNMIDIKKRNFLGSTDLESPSFVSKKISYASEREMYPLRFMLYVVPVKKPWRKKVPAINHQDNTARPQLVYKQDNPLYHKLINAFYQKTGVPLVLNTSFNLRGEPIVNSPADAYSTFIRSGIDVLIMGNYVCEK